MWLYPWDENCCLRYLHLYGRWRLWVLRSPKTFRQGLTCESHCHRPVWLEQGISCCKGILSPLSSACLPLRYICSDIASCCLYCPCFKCHCCVRCSVVIWTVCKSVPQLDSKMIIFVLCGTWTRTLLYVLGKCLRAGVSVSVWTPLGSFICVNI